MEFSTPTADELKFIYDSWSTSFRNSVFAGCVPNNIWPEVSRKAMQEIVYRGAEITVAITRLENGTRRIVGYAVSEPGVLHWIYVKKDQRGFGHGKSILRKLVEPWSTEQLQKPRYTHRTDVSSKFLGPGWKWDPIPARVKFGG